MLRSKRTIALVVVASLLLLAGAVTLVVIGVRQYQAKAIVAEIVGLAGPTDVTEDVQIDWLPYTAPIPPEADFVSVGNYRVYLNTAPDTSIVLRPTSRGVQTFMYLTGPEAASTYDFAFTLLPKTELKKDKNGTIGILDRQTKRTVRVLNKPWAKSVEDGTSHSTSFSVKGNVVTQAVDLKGATFPLIADPDFDDPLTQLLEGRVPVFKEAQTATKDGPSHNLAGIGRYYSGPNGLEIRLNNQGTLGLMSFIIALEGGELVDAALLAFSAKFGPIISAALVRQKEAIKVAGQASGVIVDANLQQTVLSRMCLGVTVSRAKIGTLEANYFWLTLNKSSNEAYVTLVGGIRMWFEECSGSIKKSDTAQLPPAPADNPQLEVPAQPEPAPPAPVEQPPLQPQEPIDYSIDMNQACVGTYGNAHAKYLNWDDPNSWVCIDDSDSTLGGLDLDGYCNNNWRGSKATLTDNNAYGWRCRL